jgi:hypothetical protein
MTYCFCLLCSQDDLYGHLRSTGMLEQHIQRHHSKTHPNMCARRVADKIGRAGNRTRTNTNKPSSTLLKSYFIACPEFLLDWMIKRYQPLGITECKEYRTICQPLNKRSPVLGHNGLGHLLENEYYVTQHKLFAILKERH